MKLSASAGIICLLLVFTGCSGGSPENAAKDFMKAKTQVDSSVTLDISKLTYKKVKSGPEKATIEVSGKIDCKGKLNLVKEKGEWIVK